MNDMQEHYRIAEHAINGAHLVALVRAGATFIDGKLVERPTESPVPTAAWKLVIHRS
ncbi:hypothetical protein [Nonomuraea rubra]|uniref:hypothetical protein n=1 Tax=Nonomuraea rubra TaxID=46180 RepID=UPI0033CD0CC3